MVRDLLAERPHLLTERPQASQISLSVIDLQCYLQAYSD